MDTRSEKERITSEQERITGEVTRDQDEVNSTSDVVRRRVACVVRSTVHWNSISLMNPLLI